MHCPNGQRTQVENRPGCRPDSDTVHTAALKLMQSSMGPIVQIDYNARGATVSAKAAANDPLADTGISCSPDPRRMTEPARCRVQEFKIWNAHGSITWLEPVDLSEAWDHLDELVQIDPPSVTVYPEGSPPVGTGLNKPARIELRGVFAMDQNGKETECSNILRRYERMLKQSLAGSGAQHLSWDPQSGVWLFEVSHFSTFRADMDLYTDSDDEDTEPAPHGVTGVMEEDGNGIPEQPVMEEAVDVEAGEPPATGPMRESALVAPAADSTLMGAAAQGQADFGEDVEGAQRSMARRRLTRSLVFPDTDPDEKWNVLNQKHEQHRPIKLTPQQQRDFLNDKIVTHQLQAPDELVLRDHELQELCSQYFGTPASSLRKDNITALRMAKAEMDSMGDSFHFTQDADVSQQSLKRKDMFQQTPAARNTDPAMYSSLLAINKVQDANAHVSWEELHDDPAQLARAGLSDRANDARRFQEIKAEISQQRMDVDNQKMSVLDQGHKAARVGSALFLSRSFRVGWGPNGELVNPGCRINSSHRDNKSLKYSVQIQHLGVAEAMLARGAEDAEEGVAIENSLRGRVEQMLLAHYELNKRWHNDVEEDTPDPQQYQEPYPLPELRMHPDANYLPQICSRFEEICSQESGPSAFPRASFLRHEASLWELINILWGVPNGMTTNRSLHLLKDKKPEMQPALERVRRNALDQWLKTSSKAYVEWDKSWESDEAAKIGLGSIFAALCSNDLQQACNESLVGGNTKLALLISQAQVASHCNVQRLLKLQIAQWKQSGMFPHHFDRAKQRLYHLLSGDVSEACNEITEDQCQSLHQWRLRFGLQYWHESTSHITEAMQRYSGLLPAVSAGGEVVLGKSDDGRVPWPRPPHALDYAMYAGHGVQGSSQAHRTQDGLSSKNPGLAMRAGYFTEQGAPATEVTPFVTVTARPSKASLVKDTAFELLTLYQHGSEIAGEFGICDTLKPCGNSPLPLDVHTSWFMLQVLGMHGVLRENSGFKHPLGDEAKFRLSAEFAYELVLLGLWEWAIYVYLHMDAEPSLVSRAVTEILYRHLPVDDDADVPPNRGVNLLLRFGLPKPMLDLCRAVRARYEADVHCKSWSRDQRLKQSVEYHIACGKFRQAEATLRGQLCPHQLIREPPYYITVRFNLLPAKMVIQQTLVASGLIPPPTHLNPSCLATKCDEDPTTLCFDVVVEVWESETWATCQAELFEQRNETRRICAQLGLSLQNLDGIMMWRLDVSSSECQKTIVDAMGMDHGRREQFQRHLQLHESTWKPCPGTFQPKEGKLTLDQQEAVISVCDNFSVDYLLKLQEQAGFQKLEKSEMFLRYMQLIRRKAFKEREVDCDTKDLEGLAQLSQWVSPGPRGEPTAFLQDGDGRPEPLASDQQELRAAVDHISKNMISRCVPSQAEGVGPDASSAPHPSSSTITSELQNISLLQNISVAEGDRLRMLQKACDGVLL